MNNQNIKICQELEEHLNDTMESNARKLIERDKALFDALDSFEGSLQPNQYEQWQVIRDQVDNMRRYAKLGKMRLMDSDENVGKMINDGNAIFFL